MPLGRRELFTQLFSPQQVNTQLLNTSLDEYDQPLSRTQTLHLLRRATFGVSYEALNTFTGKKPLDIVDILFRNADSKLSPAPPAWFYDRIRNPDTLSGKEKEEENAKYSKHKGDYNIDLGEWWFKLMKVDGDSVLEKMVLFWHDHFATQYASCDNIPAISMYLQNDLFRKNYAGSFRYLLEQITIDTAMLKYLNGAENKAEAPNENYARELLELFSLGVGNYTEQDIREAAKVLTGWQVFYFSNDPVPAYKPVVNENLFDKNAKVVFGEMFTVNYTINTQNVLDNSVKKLINVILTKKGKIAATFLAGKLYEYFVYSNPDKRNKEVIDQMAKLIVDNNFELKPVLKKLFSSKHFYDAALLGSQIMSPAESIISLTKHFKYKDLYARNVMKELGLELLNPPNVAGWKGYRAWLNTVTLPKSTYFLRDILNTNSNTELGTWAQRFSKYNDLGAFVTYLSELFLIDTITAARQKKLQIILLSGAPDFEWPQISKDKETLGNRLRVLMFEIIKAPDFFLF